MLNITINKPKSRQCAIRLTDEVYNIVLAKAKKENADVSKVIRAIVEAWVASEITS